MIITHARDNNKKNNKNDNNNNNTNNNNDDNNNNTFTRNPWFKQDGKGRSSKTTPSKLLGGVSWGLCAKCKYS